MDNAIRAISTPYTSVAGAEQGDGTRSRPYIEDIEAFITAEIDYPNSGVIGHMNSLSDVVNKGSLDSDLISILSGQAQTGSGKQGIRYQTAQNFYGICSKIIVKGSIVFAFGKILKTTFEAVRKNDPMAEGLTRDQINSVWGSLAKCQSTAEVVAALDDLSKGLHAEIVDGLATSNFYSTISTVLTKLAALNSAGQVDAALVSRRSDHHKFHLCDISAAADAALCGLELYDTSSPKGIGLRGTSVKLSNLTDGVLKSGLSDVKTQQVEDKDAQWRWILSVSLVPNVVLPASDLLKAGGIFQSAKFKAKEGYVVTRVRMVEKMPSASHYKDNTGMASIGLEVFAKKIIWTGDALAFDGDAITVSASDTETLGYSNGEGSVPAKLKGHFDPTKQILAPMGLLRGVRLTERNTSLALGLYSISAHEMLLRYQISS